MFFGLTNSPATFQMMMDDLFSEEMATGDVVIYMDDILIATTGNIDQHHHKVAHILSKLQSNDLFLKPEKCTFHRKEVEYLGVIVGNNEVKMDPVKWQASQIGQHPHPPPNFTHSSALEIITKTSLPTTHSSHNPYMT
jgi:hypothetical protein